MKNKPTKFITQTMVLNYKAAPIHLNLWNNLWNSSCNKLRDKSRASSKIKRDYLISASREEWPDLAKK